MRIRLPPAQWLLAGWFVVLALLVAGPLLGPGHLLLLDFVGGPRAPSFSFMPLPSSGEVGNTIPLLTLHAALARIHPYVPQKLLLVAPIVLSGIGVARFAIRRLEVGPFPAAYAGTLYAVNPFVYDRYLSGHLNVLLAYALLPWAFAALVGSPDTSDQRRRTSVALWLAALAIVDLHIAGMFAMLVVVDVIVGRRRRDIAGGATVLVVGGLLSAYWLLPAVFATPGPRIGVEDLAVYASRPRGVAVLPNLLGLHGFWRDEFAGATQRIPLLALLIGPILLAALEGVRIVLSTPRERRWTTTLAISSTVALFLAAGTSFPPTAGVFRWLFERVLFLDVYREPQKFVAIWALALATFGAVGLERAMEAARRWQRPARVRRLRRAIGGLMIAAAILYTYPILWGFWGQVSLSRYPEGWVAADRVMKGEGPGRLLVVPWYLYGVWGFTQGRIVANPAPSFFDRDVLVADEAGFPEVPPQSRDPFSIYIGSMLEHRDDVRAFGHLVAPLDVRYIALVRAIDWRQYSFLEQQEDLTPIFQGQGIMLFENDAWRGDILRLSSVAAVEDPIALLGSPEEEQVTKRLFRHSALTPRSDVAFPPIARALPIWSDIGPSGSGFVAAATRCTDGWRLEGRSAQCMLGAVSAFKSPFDTQELWRPLAGAWLLGYFVSGLTLLAVLLYRRSGRPQHPRSEHGI